MGKHEKTYSNSMLRPGDALNSREAKAEMIRQLANGASVAMACAGARKSQKTYEYYRKTDPEFVRNCELARAIAKGEAKREVPDFATFCELYLGLGIFRHQQQWIDLLEGRDPRDLHSSQVYRPGEPDLLIVNTPPEFGKSMTLTVSYCVYRICDDPNIRIIIASKKAELAKQFLYAIKMRLTHPKYKELQDAFAPPGGFKGEQSDGWRQDAIYVSGDARDSGQKDPTVQVLGIKGSIYGTRADLVILDDCVDQANAHEYEKQIAWIQGEVLSRLSPGSPCLLIGTRMQPQDLYSEIQDPSLYPDDDSPWTYLTQPAVLEFSEDVNDWVTLWPRSNVPEVAKANRTVEPDSDGLYPKWNGPRLAAKRKRMSPRLWAMVYMQEQVHDDAVFSPAAVKGCINGNRRTGIMPVGVPGVRKEGMDGLYIVAGLDPATSGYTAAVVMGVDRQTRRRYLLDVFNKSGCTPDVIRAQIRAWTEKYRVQEWRIEAVAFSAWVTQDAELQNYLNSRGCLLKEHKTTGQNKHHVDFGVASMTTLFDGWNAKPPRNLLELPSTAENEGMKALVEQLVTWAPDAPKGQKTDTVMALWFSETRARELCDTFFGRSHSHNRYLSQRQLENRLVVDLDELATRQYSSTYN